ncbi:MAG: hypothetical protein NZ455_08390 [Bacteroidia bacterium]|nr:hypothetical protein [Bacteroidia bacterium]
MLLREACGGCVSSAKHRSDSAARSTPTRSVAKGHAPKIYLIIIIIHTHNKSYYFCKYAKFKHNTPPNSYPTIMYYFWRINPNLGLVFF